MSKDAPDKTEFAPPVSAFVGPVAELVNQQMLAPPGRPGLLASLGKYEIIRVLGGGGMGVVLLARDTQENGQVAVKMIRSELAGDQRAGHRFVKEAGHLQKLRHKNIVPVLEVSDRAMGAYFVMPFFENGSLAGRIRPGRPMDAAQILDIACDVAEGLRFAHQRGIIHRDLKPANILLAADGSACLADFGLARSLFNDTIIDVEHEQFEGTAPYMSPGVAAGNAEDTRCDIYSFGALLYEMLTGEPPYAGATTRDIRRQILAGPPTGIHYRNAEADKGLVAIAEAAMARELRNRYADMNDVAADLRRLQEGRAPLGPHGLGEKPRRSSGAAWLGAGLVGAALIAWLAWPKSAVQHPPAAPANHSATSAPVVVATPPPHPVTEPIHATSIPPPPAQAPAQPIVQTSPAPPPSPRAARGPGSILAGAPDNSGSADGLGAAARFRGPQGIVVDSGGDIFVADGGNNTIRMITPDGLVSTLAGLAGASGSADNLAGAARFFAPFGLARDKTGNLYVAELGNCAIRKITASGAVSTLAGLANEAGNVDGVGINAQFRNPEGLAVNAAGDVFVADTGNSVIRKIAADGKVVTFAGDAGKIGATDGAGSAARFWQPCAVAVDGAGNVYVSDTWNNIIRKITPAGVVTTIAGLAGNPGNVDGVGADARFDQPQGIAIGADGSIYVAEPENRRIRKILRDGSVTTLPRPEAASGGSGFRPSGVAVDGAGILYVTDATASVLWKISP
jgi:sugar lactone lactonase YvrE